MPGSSIPTWDCAKRDNEGGRLRLDGGSIVERHAVVAGMGSRSGATVHAPCTFDQVGPRIALDDPVADLGKLVRVHNTLQQPRQSFGRCSIELPRRHAAQQRPFFGPTLFEALLKTLLKTLLEALLKASLETFPTPLLGPFLHPFRQHRLHLFQARHRGQLPPSRTCPARAPAESTRRTNV